MSSPAGTLYYLMIAAGLVHISYCRTESMLPPPQCDPNNIEEAPYQLQKVCAALSTIYKLSNAMETYLEESSPRQLQYIRAGNNERFDNSVKRQDLDHVFLRFGRRRR